ncbi:MAG: LacI family DNA-binding transcriptional regulator [Hamadaea sp.]|uniref:LacI family DNA-binding transcriptional regulator n=1 Tax=Hamadaea sp. TaxID=2024425 RepID=UPI0017B3C4B3|nr:LacI family DNA-binding transcriptional regulator [Hamadaea sp.]NUR70474.1 LacI family DNA-binding transcriptional regulator [Hamadaea sp.]NUT18081.1 LacI family DNA-binding transcriptional regulator [Hamadaea sp.]
MHVSPRASRPTIHDVARVAGVSRGTVSRALNGDAYVSAAALAAVQRAVAETGYVVNRAARSLVTRQTGSVLMVLSEPQEKLFEDPNYSTLMRVAMRRLAQRDISLVIMLSANDGDRDRVIRYVRGGHCDGVLLVTTHSGDPLLDELGRAHIPAVTCGEIPGGRHQVPYAAADDRGGAQRVTQYLADSGRRRIATITGPLDTPGGLLRLEGFCDVLGRKATKKLIAYGDWTRHSGEVAMTELLERSPDLDAVFVGNDLMAAGALAALRAAGRRVPEDVAVVGFDDSSVAMSTHPLLTTMRQPLEQVAEETVRLLLELIDGAETVESVVLPTELIVRESA